MILQMIIFRALSAESIIEIYKKEASNGNVLGAFVQFGGQTPLKIAKEIESAGIKIIGTSTEAIDLAEDRDRFSEILNELNINQPKNGFASSVTQTIEIAESIGYLVLIRPSYVLGGRAMQIAYDSENLKSYTQEAMKVSANNTILIDEYLENAKEIDVDLIVINLVRYLLQVLWNTLKKQGYILGTVLVHFAIFNQ